MSFTAEMTMTIDTDEEVDVEAPEADDEMDGGFVFGDNDDFEGELPNAGWSLKDILAQVRPQDSRYDNSKFVSERIEGAKERLEARKARQKGGNVSQDVSLEANDRRETLEAEGEDRVKIFREAATSAEVKFYDKVEATSSQQESSKMFTQLNLSRPILRGVEAMGFVTPTAIQSKVIPLALMGRDICGSAVTGSGKTAAFLLPALERLLFRPRDQPATRLLVVTPTRELAAQCHAMLMALARYTDIKSVLVCGGAKNLKSQAAELRGKPDCVIATPGRLLDHLQNSSSVHLDDLDILVLDEVDRLLELGFQEEIGEILKYVPVKRQTLLFSATFTENVEDLLKLALKRPVRVMADAHNLVAPRLQQEFVRLKPNMEKDRVAILAALLKRTFTDKVMVFFDTKAEAHFARVLLGLLDIRCAELHGNVTQTARLEALQSFKENRVDVLLCTDLAARGIDVSGLQTVVNYNMPRKKQTYIHRVGRTARAGCGGRSVTLAGEDRRALMKEVIKDNQDSEVSVKARTVPASVVAFYRKRVEEAKGAVDDILREEETERKIRIAEMEANKAQNLVTHKDEIAARPQKTWFQSERQKREIKKRSKKLADGEESATKPVNFEVRMAEGETGPKKAHRLTRKKRRRIEAEKELERATREEAKAAAAAEENGFKGRKGLKQKDIPSVVTENDQKGFARRKRKEDRLKTMSFEDAALSEHDKPAKKTKKQKRSTASESSDIVVGSGFEEEMGHSRMKDTQKEEKSRPSAYNFTEFDPDRRLRKGAKKSKHAFKSKKRYQRR